MSTMDLYEEAIHKTVDSMKDEFGADLQGMLLGGSVAYGSPCKRSDLDIYVIVRRPWRQRRTTFVDGVEVELFINPVRQIRKEIQEADPATCTMFARGRVLHDPDGVIASLVSEARAVREQPRPEVRPEDVPLPRYQPTDLLKDAQDLAGIDEAAAKYLIFVTLQATMDAYYRIARRWPPKPKHLLRDLHAHAPELEQAVRRVLSCDGPAADRCAALAALVEDVLRPVGGLLGEWESVPEPIAGEKQDGEVTRCLADRSGA